MDKPPLYSPPGVATPQAEFVTQQPGTSEYAGHPTQQGYPPQSGYAPQSGHPTQPPTQIYLQPPAGVYYPAHLGPYSESRTCPSCHAQISTTVRLETSIKTHFFAAFLCPLACCCLPYCFDSCKSRNHYCPNCNAYIGSNHVM